MGNKGSFLVPLMNVTSSADAKLCFLLSKNLLHLPVLYIYSLNNGQDFASIDSKMFT